MRTFLLLYFASISSAISPKKFLSIKPGASLKHSRFPFINFATSPAIKNVICTVVLSFITLISFSQTTIWTGASNTSWATAGNWTNGVPTAATDVIVGDRVLPRQPIIGAAVTCKSLTLGGLNVASLTANANLTVIDNVTINSNGTLTQAANNLTLSGNWNCSGTYSGGVSSYVIFAGTAQTISGSQAFFDRITINAGSTVTLNTNIRVDVALLVNGTLNPNEIPATYQVSGAGLLTVGSTGTIHVKGAAAADNYFVTGGATLNGGSTVDYSATTTGQIITNFTYSTLKISGSGVKSITGSLLALMSSSSTIGNITVSAGTLDLGTFTANRGTTVGGGTLSVSDGATLRIGGTNTFPSNFATRTFGAASTVEYYGTAQTVRAENYGNLSLTANSGTAVVKTMPATAMTIAGDLTLSAAGAGTTVSTTALAALTINGDLSINPSTTFSAGAFTHNIKGDLKNSGTFNNGGGVVNFNGTAVQNISGSSTTIFDDCIINNAAGVTLASPVTVNGLFTLTNGRITLNSSNLTLGAAATIGGTPSSARMVVATGSGELRKNFSGLGSFTFPVGDATGTAEYSPVTLNFTAGTFVAGAYAGIKLANTKHPNNRSATDYLNRYWVLSSANITGYSCTSTFTYVPADVAGTEASLIGGRYSSGTWTKYTAANTVTKQFSAAVTSFGDFSCGDAPFGVYLYRSRVSGLWNTTASWETSLDVGLTWSNASTIPANSNDSVTILSGHTITGDLNIAPKILTINAGGIYSPNPTIIISGSGVVTGGGTIKATRTTLLTADFNNQYTISNKDLTNLTVDYAGAGAQTVNSHAYKNLVLSNSGLRTLPLTPMSITGDLTTTGTISTSPATALTIGGNVTLGAGTGFNLGTGTYNIGGNWTDNGATVTALTSTVNFNGTATQTIGGTAATLSFTNLTISNISAPVLVSKNTNITGILNLNGANTVLIPAATVVFNSALPAGIITGTGTIQVTRVATTADYASQYKFLTNTLSNVTVDYAGSGDQIVNLLLYANLKASGSGTKTVTGSTIVNGVLTIGSGVTLNMGTNLLTGLLTGTAGTGTLTTQNTSIIPLPEAKTWACTVNYNSTQAQNIVSGNYTNLGAAGGNRTLSIVGSIGIAGTFTPGSGTYTTTGSTVDFNGATAQTIPAIIYHRLNVSGGNTKSVGGSVIINDALNISANTTLALGANNITLRSDSTNTARVGIIPTTAAITYGTGRFVVERYVPGRRKYRLITSPVTTSSNSTLTTGQEAQSIWGNWQNAGVGTSQNVGTLITGGSTADGFDQQTTNSSLFTYDAAGKRFVPYSSANGKNTKYTPLKAGVGYYMFVYGDRQNSVTASNPRPTVLTSTGTLLTGDQIYNNSSAIPLSSITGNYTLMGNPFACTIDWKTVIKYNVSKTIWGWDANMSSTGAYVTVTANTTGAIVAPISDLIKVSRYVQPGQAFFVQTTGANPELIISEFDKVDDPSKISNRVFRTGQTTENTQPLIAINLLYDNAGTKVLADGAVAAFDPSFSNQVTDEDAGKMTNTNEGVAIVNGTNLLSIETRQLPANNEVTPLSLSKLTKAQYTLQIFASKMEGTTALPYLEDVYLNSTKSLSLNDTNNVVFNISTSIPASFAANRFRIVWRGGAATLSVKFTSIKAVQKDKSVQVDWNVAEESAIRMYEIERSSDGITFSKAAEVQPKGNGSTQSYTWLDNNPFAGNNYYRIRSVEADGNDALSKVAVVKLAATSEITIYPNPVKNRQLMLQVLNAENDLYTVQLWSVLGRELQTSVFVHAGGRSLKAITINNNIPAGIYYVKVTAKKSSYSQPVLIE